MNPKETYQNKQWLEEKMVKHGSGEEIARHFDVSASTIQIWLKKLGIKNGSINQPNDALYKSKNWLISQYEIGKTVKEIANECNVSDKAITRFNRKFDINPKEYYEKIHHPYKNASWLTEQVIIHGNGLAISKATGYPVTSINRYITKYDLIERKYETKHKADLNVNYFEKIDTEEKAYWLGFIMADGNMYERKNSVGSKYTMSIQIKSVDKNHLEKFKKAISFTGEIKTIKGKRNETATEGVQIRINNIKFCEDLIRHQIIPRKSGYECIPETIPLELIRHFIRGYFDGDGSITIKNAIAICVSDKLSLQLEDYFGKINIEGFRINQQGSIKVLRTARKKLVYKFLRHIYKDATVYLDRKYYRSMNAILQYESAL